MNSKQAPKRWPKGITLALATWFVGMTLVMTSLAARHLVALPAPESSPKLVAALSTLRQTPQGPDDASGWMMVHVLYGPCPCSGRLVEHLVERGARQEVSEHVLLVQDEGRFGQRLSASGYNVHAIDPEQLAAQFQVESSPMLMIVDPEDQPRYLGGYTYQKQGPAPQELALLTQAMAGQRSASLPILGCAVSAQLRRLINPLNLR